MYIGNFSITYEKPEKVIPIEWYRIISAYGIITLLLCKEILEEDEFYEQCGEINKTIEQFSIDTGIEYPKVLSEELWESTANHLRAMTQIGVSMDGIKTMYDGYTRMILEKLGYTLDWKWHDNY